MKWLLILQFLLVSMFSISPIEHQDTSSSVIYLEQVDVNAPGIDNNPIKPIKEILSKYFILTAAFEIAENEKLTHQFETKEIFNSHLTSTQLARSPPFPFS
ncbi:hypothetical protein [Halobacteriovorax sp.]|uniref:hypothetical protein n=1 Tax=Halobacteriovorax sp. TaxID=2020862 RepID=UPI003568DCC6